MGALAMLLLGVIVSFGILVGGIIVCLVETSRGRSCIVAAIATLVGALPLVAQLLFGRLPLR